MRSALEEYALRIGEEAVKICNEDRRKIIKPSDVEEATLRLKPRARTFEWSEQDVLFRSPVRRIMRRAGADRISAPVIMWMQHQLEEYAHTVSEDAVSLRRYGGVIIKANDVVEAARSGGVYPIPTRIPIEILVDERWLVTGRHLTEGSTIRIARDKKAKVRLHHQKRGKRDVLVDDAGSTPLEIELPRLPKRHLLREHVIHTLEYGDDSEEILIIPRGYGEDSILQLIRIAIEANFGGLELEHGPIFLPSGFHEGLMKRGHELSKEYGNIVSYHLLRRQIMEFLKK
jgi:histone H3/H4